MVEWNWVVEVKFMRFLDTSALVRGRNIKTASRLQKWWLTTFRGFEVEQVMKHPHHYLLGRLTYRQTWVLRPPRESEQSH